MQQARALADQLSAANHLAEGPARFLVHTLLDQADHALRANELHVAREAANQARARAERFASMRDTTAAWLADASACWDRLGEIARAGGVSAQDAFARAVEMRRMARDRAPDDARHARGLAAALSNTVTRHWRQTERTARAFQRKCCDPLRLMETAPDDRVRTHWLSR
jgi:hypothetical protein